MGLLLKKHLCLCEILDEDLREVTSRCGIGWGEVTRELLPSPLSSMLTVAGMAPFLAGNKDGQAPEVMAENSGIERSLDVSDVLESQSSVRRALARKQSENSGSRRIKGYRVRKVVSKLLSLTAWFTEPRPCGHTQLQAQIVGADGHVLSRFVAKLVVSS